MYQAYEDVIRDPMGVWVNLKRGERGKKKIGTVWVRYPVRFR